MLFNNILDLVASGVAFVVIFLFVPSLQPAYYSGSFSWFAILLIEWSCMNACRRWDYIRIRKEWTDQNGRRQCIERYSNLMEEIETLTNGHIAAKPKIITLYEAVHVEATSFYCKKHRRSYLE